MVSFRASLDLTRLSQGRATGYRAPICGSVEVRTLGWHLSSRLYNVRVNQTDGVRVSAQTAVPPHIVVEGNLTWETRAPERAWVSDHCDWLAPTPQGVNEKGDGASSPCLNGRGIRAGDLMNGHDAR